MNQKDEQAQGSELSELLGVDPRTAWEIALDDIQKACAYFETEWEYPGQVTRDVRRACAERDRYRAALERIVTEPHTRLYLLDIAREALSA